MPQLLAPLLNKAAAALIEAVVTGLLLHLWRAYARNWHASVASAAQPT
jgi:hypothetical protein